MELGIISKFMSVISSTTNGALKIIQIIFTSRAITLAEFTFEVPENSRSLLNAWTC